MSAEVEDLWKRLKVAACECAEQGQRLSERDATALVLKTIHAMKMVHQIPETAVDFYAAEILSITEGYDRTGATA